MEYKDWLDELMARTDLVQLISKYVPLAKRGASYWGCCPFHHEKMPSFSVNSELQLYHCFGCKEGGNAITFVKKIESVDSAEAIRILAKAVNMEPPPSQRGAKADDAALAAKRERLYALMRDAARHYHENLKLPAAGRATEYLRGRELDERMITRFGLGYSVDGKEMIAYLEAKGYGKSEMRDAGLIAQRADEWYDVFYGRLVFPIINNFGEVVAFGGRVLEAKPDFAKYRNSSQTVIFDKSRTLYAVNLLKKRKMAAPIEYVIMAEGYMDVISLHSAGFDTAVASMGTSLTYNQAKQLKNYSPNVYISYDGDTAGQKATMRGLDILAEAGLHVKVVCLPDGYDPDDVIRKRGKEAYQSLLDGALTLPAFKIEVLKKQYDVASPDGKSEFAVQAVKVVKALKNPVEQEEYLKIVQRYTGYSMQALLRQAEITPAPEPSAPEQSAEPSLPDAAPETKEQTKQARAVRFVLASVLHSRPYVDLSEDLYPLLPDGFAREVYAYCIERVKNDGGGGISGLYNRVDDGDRARLDELAGYEFLEGDTREKYLASILTLRISALEKSKLEIARQFDRTKDFSLVQQIGVIENKLKTLKSGTSDED